MRTTQPGREPYFEGWYLKLQTRDGRSLALIPALHIDALGRRSASMQVAFGGRSWLVPYPMPDVCRKPWSVCMGPNRFSEWGAHLLVARPGCSLTGALRFGPFSRLRSDIMGPFRLIPGMECAHGVLSMGHALDGALRLNGELIDFSGGTGYIETDRGRSFPRAYLWTQCAWRGEQPAGVMLSVAEIPLAGRRFTGCICAILFGGREYCLATYRGARVEAWSQSGAVIRQGRLRLELEIPRDDGLPLRAPVDGAMRRGIRESLSARASYRFRVGRTLLFEHTDRRASFETVFPAGAQPDSGAAHLRGVILTMPPRP